MAFSAGCGWKGRYILNCNERERVCAVSRCRADCGLKMDATLFNPPKIRKFFFLKNETVRWLRNCTT